jgi:hypothetical protein
MPGLVPGIHVFFLCEAKTWMAGTSPAMTITATDIASRSSLNVVGVDMLADLSGALFWEEQNLLVVSDLHLEKGSSFATRGVLLPPYDTVATIGRLAAVIARHDPRLHRGLKHPRRGVFKDIPDPGLHGACAWRQQNAHHRRLALLLSNHWISSEVFSSLCWGVNP